MQRSEIRVTSRTNRRRITLRSIRATRYYAVLRAALAWDGATL